jgi:hypothetical protein
MSACDKHLLGLLKLFATICFIDSGGVELARNLKIRPLNIQYESYAWGMLKQMTDSELPVYGR